MKGSASSGVETVRKSTSSIRDLQSPPPSHISDSSFTHASIDSLSSSSADVLITYLQQENVRLHQEVVRLNQQLEWSNRSLAETEKKLEMLRVNLPVWSVSSPNQEQKDIITCTNLTIFREQDKKCQQIIGQQYPSWVNTIRTGTQDDCKNDGTCTCWVSQSLATTS